MDNLGGKGSAMRKRFAAPVLVVALALVGAGIVLALASAYEVRSAIHPMRLPSRFPHVETRSFAVTGQPTFALTGHRGAVTISRGDDARVVIQATIHANPNATLASLGVTITRNGDAITVTEQTERGFVAFGPVAAIDYDVRVPAHTTVALVQNSDGPIAVSDIIGTLELSSGNGPITVRGFDGTVTAHTSNGRVLLSNGSGVVNLTTENAAIEVRNVQATSMTVQSMNGHVSFAGALVSGANGRIETTNGAVSLSLPAGSGFTLDAHTTNGGVNVAFPVTTSSSSDRRDRNTVQGTVGAPDSTLTIHSANGSITIGKQG